MINRRITKEVKKTLTFFSVVSIIGPRQVGKTTLDKEIMSESVKTFFRIFGRKNSLSSALPT